MSDSPADPRMAALIDKELMRQELRRLPIEDKLKIVAMMQRRSNAIRRATGRPERPEWPLEAVGLTPDAPPPRMGSIMEQLDLLGQVREARLSAPQVAPDAGGPGVAAVEAVYRGREASAGPSPTKAADPAAASQR